MLESNIGVAWLEVVAYTFDILCYQLDSTANEMFLNTARDRESVVMLDQMVGYRLRGPTSASLSLVATIETANADDIILQKGTTFLSVDNLVFEFVEDQIIPAGSTSATVTAVQGTTITDVFTSDGSEFQEFKLTSPSVIEGTVSIDVDGFDWTEVESLVYSSSSDESYQLRYDVDDYVYVKFGNNTSGMIPSNGSTITVSYRVGGGIIGNINIGDIDNVNVNGLVFGSSPEEFIPVTLFNQERGSGGEDRETLDHAKFWIPRFVTTNGRAVTEADFDTLASLFTDPIYGAPAYAKARLKQRIPELNTVELFVWARDSEGDIVAPSSGLKGAIQDYFDNNGSGAIRLITVDPYRDWETDRKSTRLNSSHITRSRMPSSA